MVKEAEQEAPDLTVDAATRAARAQERVGEAHPNAAPHSAQHTATKHFDSSYQTMLFGSAGTLEKPAWSDSTKGRLAIRLFSRGILGAAMFTAAGRISRAQLLDYDPHTFEWSQAKAKPLQGLAKIFDEVFARPIAKIASATVSTKGLSEAEAKLTKANAEWDATMFRTASYYHSNAGRYDHKLRPMNGRSLGSEMVAVSFDFAMMSVGDGMGRNFVQMIDPHIRKTWMVNDQGEKAKEGEKSHFSLGKFGESIARSTWRIVSKNQGEDWVAALPYVYQMRWQRKMLSKAFGENAGTKLAFDHAWNGAAYKVNTEGRIIGDHQLAGAMDLHARFVGYNVYTLMFREGYDTLGHKLKEWRDDNFRLHMPEHVDPISGAKDAVRYFTKSVIKANLYMNPAVIPFWMMRTPQTKWRGALICSELPEHMNAIASTESQMVRETRMLSHVPPGIFHGKEPIIYESSANHPVIFNFSAAKHRILPGWTDKQPETMWLGNHQVHNPMHGMKGPNDWRTYEHYEPGISTTFSKILNPFGQFSYWLGGKATALAEHLPEGKLKNYIGLEDNALLKPRNMRVGTAGGREQFMRNFVDSSLAYTPYFMAKSEFGLRVDDTPPNGKRGNMDNAIYKLIDNVCAVKPAATVQSVKDIWHLSTHRDKVIMREGSHNNPDPIAPNAQHPITEKMINANLPQPKVRGVVIDKTPAVSADTQESSHSWADSVIERSLSATPDKSPTIH